ncbi:unnamed protein product [Ceutorhynchus assimilis]|uniref:Carboxylic ester hydrolase n=1 Tax=Ceutorhynchus assimilis TaxID=467358 RepID=A0A9N9MKK9_9CUCU|nr:unnamed protein product [Ceutorhynchus assimilis]
MSRILFPFLFVMVLILSLQAEEHIEHQHVSVSLEPEPVVTTTSSQNPISTPTTTSESVTETNSEETDENPLIVDISTGKIEGQELKTVDQKKPYYAFQGIPYAKPPVGELRFMEPVPAETWNYTMKTVKDGPMCVQLLSTSGSEDCLYLNVYSPKTKNEEKLPVMVWIYGEAFVGGSSKMEKFGPDYFLEQDVILVSFNYRTGVFGFLSTGDYAATGNWGLKDQILALNWVQQNIEKFGGDSKDVTLFGQSAGAACVSILIESPLARGLFHKAIMQSGTSLNSWAHSQNAKKSVYAMAQLLDINTSNTNELVEHLRKVDYRTLHMVSVSTGLAELLTHNALSGLIFAPCIEVNHPGAVLTNFSHSIMKNGDFSRIPVMVGFNSEEGARGVDMLTFLKPYVASYDLFSTRLVPASLNIERSLQKIVAAQLIRMKYFGLMPIRLSNKNLIGFITDDQFVRPIYEYIKQCSKYTPTYFYIFSYEGALGVKGENREPTGVGHSEENHYLWNQEDNIENAPIEDILTRQRLIRLWTNFAKTGYPTPENDALLQNVTWPPTNFQTMVYLNITKNLELGTNVEKYNIQFWDHIFQRFGNPPYDTY